MGVCRQIQLVLWKNFTIRRRRWVSEDSCGIFIEKVFCLSLAAGAFRNHLAFIFIPYFNVGSDTKFSFLL